MSIFNMMMGYINKDKHDIAWDYYCDSDRPEDIFIDICPEDYQDEFDMFDYYDKRGYENYTKTIDKDFEDWYNNSYRKY